MSKKVAVILSGCGHLDGAEIRESTLSLLALDRLDANVQIFAPDRDQHHVVNHLKGEELSDKRNILGEASRIARGKIEPLKNLRADQFDHLILPGGFGVAKNLCTFAFEGSACSVDENVKNILLDFYSQKKSIGAMCISPALVAKCLGDKKITVTIGNDKETAAEIEKSGAIHKECPTDNCVVDKEHKIVTTPAYMDDNARLAHVEKGITKCIEETLRL